MTSHDSQLHDFPYIQAALQCYPQNSRPVGSYISGCGCPIRFKMVAISSPHMHIQRIGLMKCFACFLTLQNACMGVGCPLTHPKSVALEASSLVKLYFNYHCSNIWMLAICMNAGITGSYIATYISLQLECVYKSGWNVVQLRSLLYLASQLEFEDSVLQIQPSYTVPYNKLLLYSQRLASVCN